VEATSRESYPFDATDDEWAIVSAHSVVMDESAVQRRHDLREAFDAPRWTVRAGAS
jgi:hypothetical protein